MASEIINPVSLRLQLLESFDVFAGGHENFRVVFDDTCERSVWFTVVIPNFQSAWSVRASLTNFGHWDVYVRTFVGVSDLLDAERIEIEAKSENEIGHDWSSGEEERVIALMEEMHFTFAQEIAGKRISYLNARFASANGVRYVLQEVPIHPLLGVAPWEWWFYSHLSSAQPDIKAVLDGSLASLSLYRKLITDRGWPLTYGSFGYLIEVGV
jgi:hypothetical protein